MATTTVAHASLIRYDSAGNQLVINLKNTGDDVSISRSSNGNLPTTVTSAQTLANSLGALAFKSSLSKSDVGLGSVDNIADANKSVKYASYLVDSHNDVGMYVTKDTHYLQLGYWICGTGYDSLTLLVSSAFWGNQHGSCDLFYLQQDMHDDGKDTTVQGAFYRTRLGGSYRREFYYHKTNGRIYLYAYVTGGNSYGRWNVSVLQSPWPENWVNEKVMNCTRSTEWIVCDQYYTPFEDNLYVSQSTPGHPCIWAKID